MVVCVNVKETLRAWGLREKFMDVYFFKEIFFSRTKVFLLE